MMTTTETISSTKLYRKFLGMAQREIGGHEYKLIPCTRGKLKSYIRTISCSFGPRTRKTGSPMDGIVRLSGERKKARRKF